MNNVAEHSSTNKKYGLLNQFGYIVLVATAYSIAGKLGILLAVPPGYATPLWAPSGIALAALLLRGYSVWPGVFAGSILVNWSTTMASVGPGETAKAFVIVSCIGLGAALQACIGAFLLRGIRFPETLKSEREVVRFLLLGGPVSCLTNATVAVTALFLSGTIPIANYLINWTTWWIGDSIGVIVFTPLILATVSLPQEKNPRKSILIILALCLTFLLNVTMFLFASRGENLETIKSFQRKTGYLYEAVRDHFENDLKILRLNKEYLEESRRQIPAIDKNGLFWKWSVFPESKNTIMNQETFMRLIEQETSKKAIKTARLTRLPSSTESFDYGTGNQSRRFFLTFFPVYPKNGKKISARGFVVGIFIIEDFIRSALNHVDRDGINLEIAEESVVSQPLIFSSSLQRIFPSRTPQRRTPQWTSAIESEFAMSEAGKNWKLKFSQTQEYALAHRSWGTWIVLITGFLVTSVLGTLLIVIYGRYFTIEALVKERTASLEASQSKWRSITESAQESIVTSDENGSILSWNKAAEELFGYADTEIIGKSLSLIIPGIKALQGESQNVRELDGIKKDQSSFPMELTIGRWQMNGRMMFSAFIRDVSERKKIEQMKNDLISFAAHQLKTPAALVQGYAENILKGITGDISEKQKHYFLKIQEISGQNLRLITNLLNVSLIEQGMISRKLEPVELADIVRNATQDCIDEIQGKRLGLEIKDIDKKIIVLADMHRCKEAMRNVIENSIRFTDQGGITIELREESDFGIVEIKDTGIGISENLLPKLFTKDLIFEGQRDRGGSGLGLYIAHSFMKIQNGELSANSRPGQGSNFIFKLPKVKSAIQQAASRNST